MPWVKGVTGPFVTWGSSSGEEDQCGRWQFQPFQWWLTELCVSKSLVFYFKSPFIPLEAMFCFRSVFAPCTSFMSPPIITFSFALGPTIWVLLLLDLRSHLVWGLHVAGGPWATTLVPSLVLLGVTYEVVLRIDCLESVWFSCRSDSLLGPFCWCRNHPQLVTSCIAPSRYLLFS